MPPKKKGGKGKSGVGNIIDGVDTTQMTREQLEVFCHRIKEENEREREERNFFQLERDKIWTFWEITRNELEETKAKLRNKDRQIEESAEKNDEELKFYKQKVKHLQYEHQNNLTEAKADALVSLKMSQDDHVEQEKELLKDKRNLKSMLREQELAHEDQVKALKLQHCEEISGIRNQYELKEKELENKYEHIFANLKQDLNTKHSMENTEIEERKNTQITNLTNHHEQVFNEMKNYYNDITLNNLALISSLKDQMEVLRNQNERMIKQMADITAKNKRLVEPLFQAQQAVTEYKRQLENYEKDKLSLANIKVKLVATKQELDDLRWANDALELRFEKLQTEKTELSKKFVKAVCEVQEKTGQKNVLLQKRIQILSEASEVKEAVIGELRANITGEKTITNEKFEKLLAQKNTLIHDLKYELARVCKAHDDILDTYEDKLIRYGIPKEELGFVPLRILQSGQRGSAKGPSGLVTSNK